MKVKLLLGGTILSVAMLFIGVDLGRQFTEAQTAQAGNSTVNSYELWEIVNDYRVSNSLSPLRLNPSLVMSAAAKCADMVKYRAWSHDVNGREAVEYIQDQVDSYETASENIGLTDADSQYMFEGWKGSARHNEAMLDPRYTDVGYATCDIDRLDGKDDQTIVVQHFMQQ